MCHYVAELFRVVWDTVSNLGEPRLFDFANSRASAGITFCRLTGSSLVYRLRETRLLRILLTKVSVAPIRPLWF